jgi:type VI secretion system protein VasJ
MSSIPDIGAEPISAASPAGEDARYEPEYEAIQSEIEKLASPTSEGVTDWAKIVEFGTELLSRKSKNLLVAGYLFVGLLQSRGPDQLAPAMAMYRGMIENFWDDLFPPKKRKKARINAIEWWLEKVQAELDGFPDGFEMDAGPHAAMMADLSAIDDFLAENLDSAPLLHQLRSRLDAIPTVRPPEPEPEPEPAPEAEATSAEPEGTEAAPAEPPPAEPKSAPAPKSPQPAPAAPPKPKPPPEGEGPEPILQSGIEHFRAAGHLFIQQDPSSPVAYRLNRVAAWIIIDDPPPADAGQTMLPPPSDQDRETLAGLREKQNFAALLESAESRLSQYRFWLDLGRYVSEALFNLKYAAARRTVDEETALFVRRLPGVEALQFSDGTPLADDKTRQWLDEISAPAASADGGGGGAEDETAAMGAILGGAKDLAKEGKPAEGLDRLQSHFNEAVSRKRKLMWRMRMVQYLLYIQQPRIARPHVSALLSEIEQFSVERWDPSLALAALTQAYNGLAAQGEDAPGNAREAVLDRISGLNPLAAMRLI